MGSNRILKSKLENLSKVETGNFEQNEIQGFTSVSLYKKAGIVYLSIDDNQKLNSKKNGDVILTLPVGFRPRSRVIFSANTSSNQACVFSVDAQGRIILMSSFKLQGYLYFNISFLM